MITDAERTHLDALAQEYFLRELTPEEGVALEKGLSSDPALREHFARLSRDEWLLHRIHRVNLDNLVSFKPRPRIAARWVGVAASLVLLLGGVGGFLLMRASEDSPVVASEPAAASVAMVTELFVLPGDAVTAVNGGEVRVIEAGSKVRSGDRIVTPPSTRLSLHYEREATTLRLGGSAIVELSDQAGAKHVRLWKGRLVAQVDTQPPSKPMRISTDDAEAVVLGTAFELQTGEATRLAVTRGKVQFSSVEGPDQVLVVEGGHMAEAFKEDAWQVEPFQITRLRPVSDTTVNQPGSPEHTADEHFIVVDPARELMGLMTFNVGRIPGEIREAKLRLRVMQMDTEHGGEGDVRLFRMPPDADWSTGVPAPRTEISHHKGRVGAGMDLEFNIPPDEIGDGTFPLLLTLDQDGNDFWFSSSEGAIAPELMLKIVLNEGGHDR